MKNRLFQIALLYANVPPISELQFFCSLEMAETEGEAIQMAMANVAIPPTYLFSSSACEFHGLPGEHQMANFFASAINYPRSQRNRDLMSAVVESLGAKPREA